MLEGLYTAAAGMQAQQQRIDSVANDLANVTTTGYKHVRVGFRDLLYTPRATPPARPCTAGAGAAAAHHRPRRRRRARCRTTGQPLDVAIQGPGFFQVTPRRRHRSRSRATARCGSTRSGRLDDAATATLVQPPITRPDAARRPTDVSIAAGRHRARRRRRPLGRIQLVDRPLARRPAAARRQPLHRTTAASGAPTAPPPTRRLRRARSRPRTSTSATRWST